MPLLMHCSDVQPQMRLAEAFRWQGRTMLPGGKMLTPDDIDTLRRRYPDVTLKIGDPVLDAMVNFEDDSRDREVAATAQAQVASTLADVQDRFASRTSIASVNYNAIRDAAASVIDYLKANPVSAALLRRQNTPDNYLSDHSGSVFYLSIVLGSAIREYVTAERRRQTSAGNLSNSLAMDLTPLGLGAMLMDIAMFSLPQVFKPNYVLTDDDRQLIREHPVAGAEMLPDSLPAGVKMIARCHHENYDGTGYPDAMPGLNLHVFVRIVRICDAFVAVTSDRVHRRSKTPARAMWEMLRGPTARHYDPVLMKVFHSLIQPFPIGGKIRLSDGRYGVVVRYNRRDSFRPQMVIAFDAKGERVPTESLTAPFYPGEGPESSLKLASFAGEDLSYLDTATPAEPLAETDWDTITTPLEACYP
ncbi:MAG TPA: HD domain-containing phosphohydrolase [Tepidisphaeraceae bacterium]|nr:HD domain-containing phosphohydrolase [Tepidisphaeraceae bacterium]